jgi:hypothetical protein
MKYISTAIILDICATVFVSLILRGFLGLVPEFIAVGNKFDVALPCRNKYSVTPHLRSQLAEDLTAGMTEPVSDAG